MPPFPSRAMMRYRPASRRPGRKRPSLKYSAELEGRDELEDGVRGGSGEVAVAKSSVATPSVLPAGAPHDEQKRPVAGTSVPQDEQVDMIFPDTVYRVGMKTCSQDHASQASAASSTDRAVLPSKR